MAVDRSVRIGDQPQFVAAFGQGACSKTRRAGFVTAQTGRKPINLTWCEFLDKLVHWYQNNSMPKTIQRVQTGVRIEKRLLKVLKALAEQLDMSLGDLLEGMALHCFEGKVPFTEETLGKIEKLRDVYELDLTAEDSHKLDEQGTSD